MAGRTIALAGDTGSGKTTLIGEKAKADFKAGLGKTLLNTSDPGGYQSLLPLIKVGVIDVVEPKQNDDMFLWVADAVKGTGKDLSTYANIAFDSASNMGAQILDWITKLPQQVGQQRTQRFAVGSGGKTLQVGINNEAHFGVVQGFMRDQMWSSTWLTKTYPLDLIWTFALDRGEKADDTPALGLKVAGKALSTTVPSWFQYVFRAVSVPVKDGPAIHKLYIQEQPEMGGTGMSFGNPRYPLDAVTPLPAVIEPASLVEAIARIEQGQQEAEEALRRELNIA